MQFNPFNPARPPRPETGTGSGGATGCEYTTVFTDYESLTLQHRILPCQVWARVSIMSWDQNSMHLSEVQNKE